MQRLTLPWPTRDLSPNARVHHMALYKAKQAYKLACATVARQQGARKLQAEALHLRIEFVPPDRRHRDLDNMLASIKSGLDALSGVLGVDDSRWTLTISKSADVGGFVRVEVIHA